MHYLQVENSRAWNTQGPKAWGVESETNLQNYIAILNIKGPTPSKIILQSNKKNKKKKKVCNIWVYVKGILFINDAIFMPHIANGQHVYSEI